MLPVAVWVDGAWEGKAIGRNFFSWFFFSPAANMCSDSNRQDILELFPNAFLLHLDEEWEKDLAAEIQDFEVVDDQFVDESELDDLK